MRNRTALVTGVTGQDGSLMAELLLNKGYEVHGIKRRTSLLNTERIDHIYTDPHEQERPFILHYCDVTDSTNLASILKAVRPQEIYNFAAQSHVQVSFSGPEYSLMANAKSVINILESIRLLDMEKDVRFYQASSSEMFGSSPPPQNEDTPFRPQSPYGISKLFSYWTTVNYREAYGIHASNGILFNHEGPVRGETFVSRKVTRAVAAIANRRQERLYLGNLDARRDWGHAADFVEGVWQIVQQDHPDDYVLATGEAHTVRDFVALAFKQVDIEIDWTGTGEKEVGIDRKNGEVLVEVDQRYYRPTEVNELVGDYSKARTLLGWEPKVRFEELVALMVEADLKAEARKDLR